MSRYEPDKYHSADNERISNQISHPDAPRPHENQYPAFLRLQDLRISRIKDYWGSVERLLFLINNKLASLHLIRHRAYESADFVFLRTKRCQMQSGIDPLILDCQ